MNADDWGGEDVKTEAIRAAYAAGAISGASAMVYMPDSDRAASLPAAERPPLGLHLNLTQPFVGEGVPGGVRDRQARLVEHLTDRRHRPWHYAPRMRELVRHVISDQVSRFRTLYCAEPDHLDGHEHAHLNLDVLLALPRGTKVRPPCWNLGAEETVRTRMSARTRALPLRLRLRAPRRAYDIDFIAPSRDGRALARLLALSERHDIEILCHPGDAADDGVLASPEWRRTLAVARVGSYAEL